jgi:uncharacterized OB-fold protein
VPYKKPVPKPNADTRPFWNGCKKHQLRFQKCTQCHHVRWPPSIICPVCHYPDTEWIVASGRGKVYTFIVYRQAYHKAFEQEVPYVTAIVQLDEGPHLMTNIIGIAPENVFCDMSVEVTWEDINKRFSLPKFKPTG